VFSLREVVTEVNVFVLLGLAWVAFLAKIGSSAFSRRSNQSLRGFSALQRRNDLPPLPNPSRIGAYAAGAPVRSRTRSSARRRRDILVLLIGLALATLLPALLVGGSVVTRVHLLVDALLGVYVVALARLQRQRVLRNPQPLPVPVNVRSMAAGRSMARPARPVAGRQFGYGQVVEADELGSVMVRPVMREHRTG
jgi:Flp pilus assembly protein TadB